MRPVLSMRVVGVEGVQKQSPPVQEGHDVVSCGAERAYGYSVGANNNIEMHGGYFELLSSLVEKSIFRRSVAGGGECDQMTKRSCFRDVRPVWHLRGQVGGAGIYREVNELTNDVQAVRGGQKKINDVYVYLLDGQAIVDRKFAANRLR